MFDGTWLHTRSFHIASEATTFAPGNLRATLELPWYNTLIQTWISKGLTLRYSGGLVPDLFHILAKGQGIVTNFPSPKAKAKLRLLFEGAPCALILHYGGAEVWAVDFTGKELQPLLQVPIKGLEDRIGIIMGSSDLVKQAVLLYQQKSGFRDLRFAICNTLPP